MPHVFQTFDAQGNPHKMWRFQYTDWKGKRRTATGSITRGDTVELARHVQSEQNAIKKGWRNAPKASDAPRDFAETLEEYLAWGQSCGGRRGFGWGAGHARIKEQRLRWWIKALGFSVLKDLRDCLPRVEKALRDKKVEPRKKKTDVEPPKPFKPATGKTRQHFAEALKAFCGWCVQRGYLDEDPLKALAPFDCTPRTHRRAMTAKEIRELLDACTPTRRLLYEMAFTSGLRAGELAALKVSHLDTERGGLRLEAA